MTGRWLGSERIELAECGSTNDEADRRARAGAPHGTVIIARYQTAGRGRCGHDWFSDDPGNLYLSCVLRPELAPVAVPPITLAAGVAVCDAVNSFGCNASLKWPNDLLVYDRKLAGILTEMSTRGAAVEYVVLGIGLNLNGVAFPGSLRETAISLRLARGDRPVDRAQFTSVLLTQLQRWLDRFFRGGVPAIDSAWCERSHMIGRRVAVDTGDGVVRGQAHSLDATGALVVDDETGTRRRVLAGEVRILQ